MLIFMQDCSICKENKSVPSWLLKPAFMWIINVAADIKSNSDAAVCWSAGKVMVISLRKNMSVFSRQIRASLANGLVRIISQSESVADSLVFSHHVVLQRSLANAHLSKNTGCCSLPCCVSWLLFSCSVYVRILRCPSSHPSVSCFPLPVVHHPVSMHILKNCIGKR